MSKKPQRYRFDRDGWIAKDLEGEWVKHSDHTKVTAEKDKVIEGLRSLLELARHHVESDRMESHLAGRQQWAHNAGELLKAIDKKLSELSSLAPTGTR